MAEPSEGNGSDGDSPVCRMCFVGAEEAGEELISPCCCRGSLAYVHYECILRHFECRGVWWDLACPTCESQYTAGISLELGRYGLAAAEEACGPDSLEAALVLVSLGTVHGLAGECEQQRELLERALTVLHRDLGPDDPEVARALLGLGFAHGALGDVDMQCELVERALEINEKVHGPSSPEVAETLTVLANAFARLEDASRQIELSQRALKIYEDCYGPSNAGVANALMGLGCAYGELGDPERKRELLERAHKILVQVYGEEHFQVATVLANLGRACWSLGELPRAICLFWRSRCIFMREFGEADRDSKLANEALEELAAPLEAQQGGVLLRAAWSGSLGGVEPPAQPQPALPTANLEVPLDRCEALPGVGAHLLRAALAGSAEQDDARSSKAAAGAGLLRLLWSH